MSFSELDNKMRIYEKSHDVIIMPGIYIVARIDGRTFSKFTKDMEKPFDENFNITMDEAIEYIMTKESLDITYGYHQSDEISLLFRKDTQIFNRKERKLNSVLASIISSFFSVKYREVLSFDCRICQLPSLEILTDYFSWRREDSFRNCLNSYCYWMLRKDGDSERVATDKLLGLNTKQKHAFLDNYNISLEQIPTWQKYGTGYMFKEELKIGFNPLEQKNVETIRNRLTKCEPRTNFSFGPIPYFA